MRGADVVVRALEEAGATHLFALSGNQIMPIFDAVLGRPLQAGLVHVRHEAAAVHAADAWGRLQHAPGVALVTAGPGFANTLSALFVAQAAESPMLLLSGDSPAQAPPGLFQQMDQASMAAGVTKAAWRVERAADLGADVSRAWQLALSGRPGPVHLALPVDLLEADIDASGEGQAPAAAAAQGTALAAAAVAEVVSLLAAAERPLVLLGPATSRSSAEAAQRITAATGAPWLPMESPRGVNDPSLGAVSEILPGADLVLLLGRRLDFGLGLTAEGTLPAFGEGCRFVQIDAESEELQRSAALLGERLAVAAETADPPAAALQLAAACEQRAGQARAGAEWGARVRHAVELKPAAQLELGPRGEQSGIPAQLICSALDEWLAEARTLFTFGRWGLADEQRLWLAG